MIKGVKKEEIVNIFTKTNKSYYITMTAFMFGYFIKLYAYQTGLKIIYLFI